MPRNVLEDAAGAVFVVTAVLCAAAAARGPRRAVPATCAGALAAAAVAALGDAGTAAWAVAVGLAALALVLVVHERFAGGVWLVSWLDGVMVAGVVAALARTADADALLAAGAGLAAGGLALSRFRPSPAMLAAASALLALSTERPGVALAAGPLLLVPALRREARLGAGPDFRWTVLAALLASAFAALALLGANQFSTSDVAAGVLAIVTVLVGIARAGITVTQRIRESEARARTDELTGLGNRRQLLDRLDEVVSDGHRAALLLVDLDGFKELNDTLGHHAGDQVLRQIGPRLAGGVREHDTLARLGGDEFALVLVPGDEASASAAGLRLRAALERSFAVEGMTVHIDASVGIALHPDHARTALGLLQRADVAMYEAKRRRTGHELYRSSRDRHSRRRLALVGELRQAIEDGQLVVHYQPKAELPGARVDAVEALVRWEHPERGLLLPGEFLPLAEQSGLTRALTAFVLRRALHDAGRWRRDGVDLRVAVNLGPADLLDLGLPADVATALRRAGVPADRLQLEVSEDVVMADPARTTEVLDGLRELGVGIALDDFGAGTSSLAHLRSLQLDELKIDRSFVLRMTADPTDAAIVRTAVDLGRRLGLRVVAEGVSDAEAWALLADWGCDEAQGYLLARPMPADDLLAWMKAPARS